MWSLLAFDIQSPFKEVEIQTSKPIGNPYKLNERCRWASQVGKHASDTIKEVEVPTPKPNDNEK